jgi:hypothetical protein
MKHLKEEWKSLACGFSKTLPDIDYLNYLEEKIKNIEEAHQSEIRGYSPVPGSVSFVEDIPDTFNFQKTLKFGVFSL